MPEHRAEIAVTFTVDAVDHLPSYTDTLFIPLDEYNAMSDDDINALKQARYDNWVVAATTPPEPEPNQAEIDVVQEAENAITAARDALQIAQDALEVAKNTSAPG